MPWFGWEVVWFEDGGKGWGRLNLSWESGLQDSWLQHVGPEEPDSMRCPSQICSIHKHWCTNEGLHQISCFLHCIRALLSRVCVLQDVEERCCLLPLEKVDHPHQVVKESEAWIHGALLPSCAADALALPAPSKQVY